jgi:cytochrome P450
VLNVIEPDPPHHKRRRDRMFRFARPARLAMFGPSVTELVDQLIDQFIDAGQVELTSEFGDPLPTHAIA